VEAPWPSRGESLAALVGGAVGVQPSWGEGQGHQVEGGANPSRPEEMGWEERRTWWEVPSLNISEAPVVGVG
jgi:hypothetical protein